jgi:hypothetical protein
MDPRAIAVLLGLAVFLVAGVYFLFFRGIEIDDAGRATADDVRDAAAEELAAQDAAARDAAARGEEPVEVPRGGSGFTPHGVAGEVIPNGIYRIVMTANSTNPRILSINRRVGTVASVTQLTFSSATEQQIFDPAYGAGDSQFLVRMNADGTIAMELAGSGGRSVTQAWIQGRDSGPPEDLKRSVYAGAAEEYRVHQYDFLNSRSVVIAPKSYTELNDVRAEHTKFAATPHLRRFNLPLTWGRPFELTARYYGAVAKGGWDNMFMVWAGVPSGPHTRTLRMNSENYPDAATSGDPFWFIKIGDAPVA